MGKFTSDELFIIDKCAEQIDNSIYSAILASNDKDRMLFASCLNEQEKENFTRQEIKKIHKKLEKCPTSIAGYISAYIKHSPEEIGDDNLRTFGTRITKNYLQASFQDVVDLIIEAHQVPGHHFENEEDWYWERIVTTKVYGADCKEINSFIKFMVLADRMVSMRSILQQVEQEKENALLAFADASEENEIFQLLDDVRAADYTELQLFNIVKEKTNLEPTSLKYFFKDIDFYISTSKDEHDGNFSDEEVDQAIQLLKDKGNSEEDLIRLGYIIKNKSLGFLNQKEGEIFTYINKERLLYPFEFYSIYQLQRIIKSELEKHETQPSNEQSNIKSNDRLKVNLSVTQLALLFKMISTLKPAVFDVKTEADLLRFISANFQTKNSDPEKGISTQKLRNEFNSPDSKAVELWEKHLRTMLTEIKNFK